MKPSFSQRLRLPASSVRLVKPTSPHLPLEDRFIAHMIEFRRTSALVLNLESRVQIGKRKIFEQQYAIDSAGNVLLRLQDDERSDFTAAIERCEEEIKFREVTKQWRRNELANLREQLSKHQSDYDIARRKMYALAQTFLDRCLDVDFRATWVFEEECCNSLRKCLDQYRLVESTKARTRELKYQLIVLRNEQRRLQKQEKPVSSSTSRCGPDKVADCVAQMGIHQQELDGLEESADAQQERTKELEARLLEVCIGPWLDRQALLSAEESPTRNSDATSGTPRRRKGRPHSVPKNDARYTHGSSPYTEGSGRAERPVGSSLGNRDRCKPASQDGGSLASEDDGSSSSEFADAVEDFEDARQGLPEQQARFGVVQRQQRDRFVDHMLSFTNASERNFERLIEQRLQSERHSLWAAEADYGQTLQQLINGGFAVPAGEIGDATTPHSFSEISRQIQQDATRRRNRPPSDTGEDSKRVMQADRDRLNLWRFMTGPGSPAPGSAHEDERWDTGSGILPSESYSVRSW